MKKFIAMAVGFFMVLTMAAPVFAAGMANTRIKDIARIQGVRNNQLIGYGLVVGLAGTGDSNKSIETLQSVTSMLKEFGVTMTTSSSFKTKNVAAVMVTATLPPFAKEGDTIDLTISSMGDAKSLQGGTLLQTPLKAGNGQIYAVGQGAVSTGGFAAGRGGSGAQKNFLTVGLTPNGGIVEQSVEDDIGSDGTVSLSLAKSDFTTASRIARTINANYGSVARASNAGRIDITIPYGYRGDVVGFIAGLEDLPITPDNRAKVVVNERTGTIIIGGEVAVDEVAISQGGLNISVVKNVDVNQPPPFSMGETVETRTDDVNVQEEPAQTIVLPATTSVNDIVGAMNSIGATPRDIISILQALKTSGALHADLEII